jgi:LPXTG-motif cell wall-anchored protein
VTIQEESSKPEATSMSTEPPIRAASSRPTTSRRRRVGGAAAAATVFGSAGGALLIGLASASASASPEFLVTTLADGAPNAADCTTPTQSCSLRDALAAASTLSDSVTIRFDQSLFTGGPATLLLAGATQGPLLATTSFYLSIIGPGSDQLTISGQGNSALFTSTSTGSLDLQGMTISDGSSTVSGGAISAPTGSVGLYNVILENNTSTANGGAISVGGALNITSSTISGNTAQGNGGAIDAGSYLYMEDSTVSGNTAQTGGAISSAGYADIRGSTISDNTALAAGSYVGGGAISSTGSLLLENSTLAGNSATNGLGGAVYANYSLTLRGTTLSGNSANFGGAIAAAGGTDVKVTNTTINGNSATMGGAIMIVGPTTSLLMGNSTLYGNSALGASALFLATGVDAKVYETTITGNHSTSVPANVFNQGAVTLYGLQSQLRLIGSIVSGNDTSGGGPNYDIGTIQLGAIANVDNSFIGPVGQGLTINGSNNVTGNDPQLNALGDNGGSTKTMKPKAGSPVIDIGPAVIPTFAGNKRDQTGLQPRRSGAAADAGAFELQLPAVSLPAGDALFSITCSTSGVESNQLHRIDATTGAITNVGLPSVIPGATCVYSMAMNPVTGKAYALASEHEADGRSTAPLKIVEIDLDSGVQTLISEVTGVGNEPFEYRRVGLAFDANGVAHISGKRVGGAVPLQLYSVNIDTGVLTVEQDLSSVGGSSLVKSLALNPVDGRLYGMLENASLFTFLNDGSPTSLGRLQTVDGSAGELQFDSTGRGWINRSMLDPDRYYELSTFDVSASLLTQARSLALLIVDADAFLIRPAGSLTPPTTSTTSTTSTSSTSTSSTSTSSTSTSSTSTSSTSTSSTSTSSTSTSSTSTTIVGTSTTTAPSSSSTSSSIPAPSGSASVSIELTFAVGDSLRSGGATLTASATGAMPGSPFEAVVHSSPTVIGSGVADANGAFGGTFTLPSDLEAGAHDVTLSFTQADGTAGSVSAWFSIDESGTVTAVSYDGPTADPTSALPKTGSDSKRLVVAGGAFALLGSAVVAVAARRRQDLARRRMPN